MVKNGNFTLLLTYSGQEMLLTSSDQEWQFHIPTWQLVVKNGYLTFLLISSCQEWQFHIATDI